MNKKILMSFLLVVLIALSVSMVSAADDVDDVVAADDVDEVVEVDVSADVLSDTFKPETADAIGVQGAIDKANKSGDIVDLSDNPSYDIGNKTITIKNSNIVIKGNGTIIYGYNDAEAKIGMFHISGANVTLQGLKFINNDPNKNITYKGNVTGIALAFAKVDGGLVENCEFTDFNQGIRVQSSDGVTIQNNKFLGGMATYIIKDPTVNKETGTKALNIMGSFNMLIKNNLFDGPVLDGVSMAGGTGGLNTVINNTFIDNAYAIFFGGASTKGSTIVNNTFINCGSFKDGNNTFEGMPVISIQKSSTGCSIVNNIFNATNNSILIAAEQGNEAHGGATALGDINITGNTVNVAPGVNASSVTLFHILLREKSTLDLSAPLNVSGNVLADDVVGVSAWIADDKGNDAVEIFTAKEALLTDTISPVSYLYDTTITVSDVNLTQGESGNLVISLKDNNGNVLVKKELSVNINGEIKSVVTDSEGTVKIPIAFDNAGTYFASVMFLGEGNNYRASVASAKITVNAKPTPTPTPTPVVAKKTTLTVKKATLKVKKAKKIKVTLKAEGKAVAGKTVTIKVNKKTFKAKTNAKGVATIKVKVTKKGKYTATVSFAGDNDYQAATKKVKLTVKK